MARRVSRGMQPRCAASAFARQGLTASGLLLPPDLSLLPLAFSLLPSVFSLLPPGFSKSN